MFVKNWFVFATLLALSMASTSLASAADYAPTPRHAPRVPVARQQLGEKQSAVPPSRTLEGSAVALDSEKLKIQNYELRLFGIVPPQLSASFGPQARNAMDKLTQGTSVQCQIRDRANDGRLLATCQNAAGTDIALDLLRHGLAVTARGSLHQSELAGPYAAAEQAAQNQKIGLWSGVLPIPAPAVTKTEPKPEVAPLPPTPPAEKEMAIKVEPIPAASLAPTAPSAADLKKSSLAATANSVVESNPDALSDEDLLSSWQARPLSFLERYQLLFTGLLMLACALSVVTVILFQRRHDRHEEKRAIAAAIRGELMAAKAVCLAKLHSLNDGSAQANALAWPRIRVLVFQAYVGRIGNLGADLARQVSSIYGLASDYASFYQASSLETGKDQIADRKQALQKLIGHIETVMPKLAHVENQKFFSSAPQKDYQPMVSPPSYDPVPVLKSEIEPPLSLAAAAAEQPAPETAAKEKNEIKPETPVEKKAEEKKEEAPKEAAESKADKKESGTEAKEEEPFVAPEKQTDAKASAAAKKSTQPAPTETGKKPRAKKEISPAEEPTQQIMGKAAAVWTRIKDIKEQIHSKLVPPPVEIADQDEYMAMLKAEAELFATYDLSDVETPPAPSPKHKKSGT